MEITTKTLVAATVSVTATHDKYEVKAEVAVNNRKDITASDNGRITNGSVNRDGKTVATFSFYTAPSVNFYITDNAERSIVLSIVQEYCGMARQTVETSVISI